MRPAPTNNTPIPASLWRRLAAMVYDSLLILAIWMVLGFFVLSAFGVEEARTVEGDAVKLSTVYANVLFATMLGSAYLFFAWFWTHSGQTLGMRAWKIKVLNPDLSAISWRQSLIRFCVAPCSLLLLGAGYLLMYLRADSKTLPDLASNSIVVKN